MNKEIYFLIFISFIIFSSCKNNNNNNETKKNKTMKKADIEYIGSYYKNNNEDTIYFARIVKDTTNIYFIKGEITFTDDLNANQKITKNIKIKEDTISQIQSTLLNNNYRQKFDDYEYIMFIQIFIEKLSDLDHLDLRQRLELQIGDLFYENEISDGGTMGDIGPGGANILIPLTDWEKGFKLIQEKLNEEEILENCLIVKRLYVAEDNWNYEVVYPIDFEGEFNQM